MNDLPPERQAASVCLPAIVLPASAVRARWLNRAAALILAGLVLLALGLLWLFDPATAGVPLCGFHATTGLHCPGCGGVRATHALLHGRVLTALRDNALWVLSLPLWLYIGVSWLCVQAGRRPLPGDISQRRWFWPAVMVAALVFFVLRNLPCWPFVLLAPPG